MITLVTGCAANEENLSVEDKTEKLFVCAYEAQCTATVKSNKTENIYSYNCSKGSDGTQTIDFGDVKVLLSSSEAMIERNGEKIDTSLSEGEMVFSPDYFFKKYSNGGKISETSDGYEFQYETKDASQYRSKGKMLTDKKLVPKKIQIEDKDGKTKVDITIEKFLQHQK